MDTIDLGPSTATLAALVRGTRDDQLGDPTPCAAYAVGDLVEHVGGLARGFVLAARKEQLPAEELRDGDASRLEGGWRDRIADDLVTLAEAWAEPTAYDGTTYAGPVEMPATEAAKVALDEGVVHGWDLAAATGQRFHADPVAVGTCLDWVAGFDAPANDDGGLFGPPVAVLDDAPPLDRLLALTGRDPTAPLS